MPPASSKNTAVRHSKRPKPSEYMKKKLEKRRPESPSDENEKKKKKAAKKT